MAFNDDAQNIKRLIVKHEKRLQVLKEQQAVYGISADPRIPIEISDIEDEIERLQMQLRELEGTRSQRTIEVSPHVSQTVNIVHLIWNSLEPDLQDALSLAYNQACRDGRNVIKTRYFFAAIARLKPEPLPELLAFLPNGAMPTPIDEQITTEKLILEANPQLSGCIADSLAHLAPKVTPQQKLSSADMFVDLAKHGTGSSVAKLRRHDVYPETVDEIIDKLGWNVIER